MSQDPFYILYEQQDPIEYTDDVNFYTYWKEVKKEVLDNIKPKLFETLNTKSILWQKDPRNFLKENPFSFDKNNEKCDINIFPYCYGYLNMHSVNTYKFLIAYIKKDETRLFNENKNNNSGTYKIVLFLDTSYLLKCKDNIINILSCYVEKFKNSIQIDEKLPMIFEDFDYQYQPDNIIKQLFLKQIQKFISENMNYFYIILDNSQEGISKAKYFISYIQMLYNIKSYLHDIIPSELCYLIQKYFFTYRMSFFQKTIKYDLTNGKYDDIEGQDINKNENSIIFSLEDPKLTDIITLENINNLITEHKNESNSYTFYTNYDHEITYNTFSSYKWNVDKWLLKIEKNPDFDKN